MNKHCHPTSENQCKLYNLSVRTLKDFDNSLELYDMYHQLKVKSVKCEHANPECPYFPFRHIVDMIAFFNDMTERFSSTIKIEVDIPNRVYELKRS